MWYKKCVICGFRSSRVDGIKRIFMGKFPLDEQRCKEWVKVVGQEDLAYLPIEKLNELKYVCANHFKPEDFNKNKTRLKKGSVPSVNISASPLADELLVDFPCHMASVAASMASVAGSAASTVQQTLPSTEVQITLPLQLDNQTQKEEEESINDTRACNDDDDNIKDGDIDAGLRLESVVASNSALFSWNKKYEIVPQADEDSNQLYEEAEDTDDLIMYEEDLSQQSRKQNDDTTKEMDDTPENQEHEGFQCNCCENPIVGYRYSCVQCPDYDLCIACESRGVHALHYMLRVPGPRPYEEVQSMLELVRRQLFQTDILLKPGAAKKSIPFPADSIKLEPKDEVEEVDPLQRMTQPATVSPLPAQADELEDAAQEEEEETYAESTVGLPAENVLRKLSSIHRQAHILHKMKPQDSTVDSTVVPSENVPSNSNSTLKARQIYFPHKRKSQDSDESVEESITYFPSKNVPTKTWSHCPAHILHKRKAHDSEDPTTDLPSEDVPSKSHLCFQRKYVPYKREPQHQLPKHDSIKHIDSKNPKVVSRITLELLKQQKIIKSFKFSPGPSKSYLGFQPTYVPYKRKPQHQIAQKYSIQHIDSNNRKVVLSRIPIELLNQQKLLKSDKFSPVVANVSNVVSTDNVQSEEQSAALLVTPEYLDLSEGDSS